MIYLWSDVVTTLILFWFLFLVNFDFICQLDITSINITLIKDLAFIQKFPSSDSLLIFFSFSGFYNIYIIYTYTYTHIYIYTYTYTHTHIHIHIHIHIYIYTYTYTYTDAIWSCACCTKRGVTFDPSVGSGWNFDRNSTAQNPS